MDIYRKWSKLDYPKAKAELELALIFIYQVNFMSGFYSLIEKCEQRVFIQYLDDIKDLALSLSSYLKEGKSTRENLELVKELNQNNITIKNQIKPK